MPVRSVLDVGNCGPDHSAISAMLRKHFDVEILRSDQWSDTLAILERQPVDLILINRKLDIDYSDGMEILRQIKRSEAFRDIPVMLITNYAEHQQQAIAQGALLGFGKLELSSPETIERLGLILRPNP
ncbi:MAG: response regulator [Planctomycetota bacterium]|nr:response regulator [Planctomycetota bacterium]